MQEMIETGTSARPDLSLAVVLGAGGMAMAVARRLGARHRLLLADRDPAHLQTAIAALRQEGHDAQGIVCDVTEATAVAALAGRAAAAGRLGVLAHVVGLSPSMGDWRGLMRVDLLGPVLVAEALLPLAGPGTVAIFVSSLAGHLAEIHPDILAILDQPLAPDFLDRLEQTVAGEITPFIAYHLSKAALTRLCRQRVRDWAERGARIVSISPGLIATPMGAREFRNEPSRTVKLNLIAGTPLRREGTMLEIADAFAFLASERASYITGTDLLIDGGCDAALHEKMRVVVARR